MTGKWVRKWPTSPGWYWFYGLRSNMANRKMLIPVEAKGTSNPDQMLYLAGSAIMFDDAKGVWQPMEVPELPE